MKNVNILVETKRAVVAEFKKAAANKGRVSWHDEAVHRARVIAGLYPNDYRPGGVFNVQALAEALTNAHPPDGLAPINAKVGTVRNELNRRRAELAE